MKKAVLLPLIIMCIGLTAQDTTNSTFDKYADYSLLKNYVDSIIDTLSRDPEWEIQAEGQLKSQLHWLNFWGSKIGTTNKPIDALRNLKTEFNNHPKCTTGNLWKAVGPMREPYKNNVQQPRGRKGVVTAVEGTLNTNNEIDVVYAGTGTSGVFKSTNGGVVWSNITDQLNLIGLGIQCLKLKPDDDDVLLVGTGTTNKGLQYSNGYNQQYLISYDAGNTWINSGNTMIDATVGDGIGSGFVLDFEFDPNDPDIVYAAMDNKVYKGVFTSQNTALQWVKIHEFSLHGFMIQDIEIDISNSTIMYVAGNDRWQTPGTGKVYKLSSLSGTIAETDITPSAESSRATFAEIEQTSAQTGYVYTRFLYPISKYTNNQAIYKQAKSTGSISGGYPKAPSNSGSSGPFCTTFKISPYSDEIAYHGGITLRKYNSSNPNGFDISAGRLHADIRDVKILKAATNSSGDDEILLVGHDGGISISYTGGQTNSSNTQYWKLLNGYGLNITEAWNVGVKHRTADLLIGTHDNGSFLYTRESDKWNHIIGGDGYNAEIHHNDDNKMLTNANATVYVSTNGITSGTSITSNREGLGEGHKAIFHPTKNNTIVYEKYIDNSSPVRRITEYNYSTSVSNDLITQINSTNNSYSDFEFAPNNANILYAAEAEKLTFEAGKQRTQILRVDVTNGPPVNITTGLDNSEGRVITDIEVHPFDANIIWITLGNFNNSDTNGTVQKGEYNPVNETITWTDISYNLPNIPHNKIKYNKRTGYLYVANDIGVWYKTVNSTQWYCFSNGLPPTVVNDLEIDYCRNMLLAATYGRGVWETNLVKTPYADNTDITTSTTINTDYHVFGDLAIKNGATLEIKGTATNPITVTFDKYSDIMVYRGAKLDIEYATLTNSCSSFWNGIQVLGDAKTTQSPIDQGWAHIKNSTIQNAVTAIRVGVQGQHNSGGGMLYAENSTFINNQNSIIFEEYNNVNNKGVALNDSWIKDCDFKVDTDWNDFNAVFENHVVVKSIKRLPIENCTFDNTFGAFTYGINKTKGDGIYAANSNVAIKNCQFSNLYRGLFLGGAESTPSRVSNSTFTNNHIGAFVEYDRVTSIHTNGFYGNRYGLLIFNSVGFEVMENTFGNAINKEGISAYQLGKHSNQIYKNDFNTVTLGIRAEGNSNMYSNEGLSFKCNNFNFASSFANIVVPKGSIDKSQGYCTPSSDPLFVSSPAGNLFTQTCPSVNPGADFGFWFNTNAKNTIYSHHQPASETRVKPDCYSSQKITVDGCLAEYTSESCNRAHWKFSVDNADLFTKLNTISGHYRSNKDEFNTKQSDYDQLIDSNQTDLLLLAIANSNSSTNLYAILSPYSPFLSDTVLEEAIYHGVFQDTSDLYNLLVANSRLSEDLIDIINGNTNLTTHQKEQLLLQQTGISARQEKELEIRFYQQQAELSLNDLLLVFAHDTLVEHPLDSAIKYLEDYNSIHTYDWLAQLYIEKNDLVKATVYIDSLKTHAAYKSLATALNSVKKIKQNNDSLPAVFSDTLLLDSIALDSSLSGSALARNLMFLLVGKKYEFVLDSLQSGSNKMAPMGNTRPSSEEPNNISDAVTSQNIMVYPNPNQGRFVITWDGLSTTQPLYLQVHNLQGQQVYKQLLHSNNGKETIVLGEKNTGVYLLSIKNKNELIYQQRLVIY